MKRTRVLTYMQFCGRHQLDMKNRTAQHIPCLSGNLSSREDGQEPNLGTVARVRHDQRSGGVRSEELSGVDNGVPNNSVNWVPDRGLSIGGGREGHPSGRLFPSYFLECP